MVSQPPEATTPLLPEKKVEGSSVDESPECCIIMFLVIVVVVIIYLTNPCKKSPASTSGEMNCALFGIPLVGMLRTKKTFLNRQESNDCYRNQFMIHP
jgi:hypothetical protein